MPLLLISSIILLNTFITSSSVNVLIGTLNVREYAIDFSSSPTLLPVYTSNTLISVSNLPPLFLIIFSNSKDGVLILVTIEMSLLITGYIEEALYLIGFTSLINLFNSNSNSRGKPYFSSPSTASITRSQSSMLKLVEQGRLTIYLR